MWPHRFVYHLNDKSNLAVMDWLKNVLQYWSLKVLIDVTAVTGLGLDDDDHLPIGHLVL